MSSPSASGGPATVVRRSARRRNGNIKRRKRGGDDEDIGWSGDGSDGSSVWNWPPVGSIPSKLAMSGGQLINMTSGERLAKVATHGISRTKIGQHIYEFSIEAGTSPQVILKVALVKTTSTRPAKHQESVLTFVNELEKRIADLAAMKQESDALQSDIVESGDVDGSTGKDLLHMLAIMSNHNSRIKELQDLTALEVEFEEETVEESVLLPPYKAVELGEVLEGALVMWCPAQAAGATIPRVLLRESRRETEEKSEEMPPVVHRVAEKWQVPMAGHRGWDVVVSSSSSGKSRGEAQTMMLVTDPWNHQVHVVNWQGKLVRALGVWGHGPGQFDWPAGLVMLGDDDDNNRVVAVVDSKNHRVSLWNVDGTYLRSFGRRGSAAGEFKDPYGIAASADHLFVADFKNNRVQVFGHDGVFVREVGKKGNVPRLGQLDLPVRVAVGDDKVVVWCEGSAGSVPPKVVSVFSEADGVFLRCIEFEGGEEYVIVTRMGIRSGMLYLVVWTKLNRSFQLQVFTLTAGTFVRRCDLGICDLHALDMHAGGGEESGSVGVVAILPTKKNGCV